MTQLFHQFRTRSRALAQGLLLVLLASWLSAACAHCLDRAGLSSAPAMAEAPMHCHEAPPPAEMKVKAHDCCSKMPASSGGGCAQISAVVSGEPLSALVPQAPMPVLVSADFLSYAYPSTPPPAAPVVHTAVFDACPRYLRNCSFLN